MWTTTLAKQIPHPGSGLPGTLDRCGARSTLAEPGQSSTSFSANGAEAGYEMLNGEGREQEEP